MIPFGSLAATAGVEGIPRTISVLPFATQLSALHFFALAFFFSAALVLLESAGRIRKLVLLITIFGAVFAFFSILQFVLSPTRIYGIYEARSGAPFGTFVNRHNFAAYMEMTMALPLGMMFAGAVNRDKKLLYVTGIGLMGVALLLSGSRGGLVAFLAQIVLLVILTVDSKRKSNFALKTALAVVLVVAIVGGSFFVGGESSLTRLAETATSQDITTDRAHIWSVTLDVITNNMPFGAGLGAFGVAYTAYDTYSGLERVEQAHNDYLQVLADAGIVGLILGGIFLFLIIRLGMSAAKSSNLFRRGVAVGAFSGIFAILVHSIFDFVLHTTAISVLFLTLTALLVASGRRYDDDLDERDIHGTGERRPRRKASVKPFRKTSERVR
ncbi:MAG TPA: O-antigen ligase family protein [Pyrinomonadaceae bacterium]|nr:O-antigen ligase family protein [Pyrinomonadaceae bacterium]